MIIRISRFFRDIRFNIRMRFQRIFRGYSDDEVWDLGFATLFWMLPRLKAYRKSMRGFPVQLTADQWEDYVDKLIHAITLLKADNDMKLPPDEFGKPRYGLTKEEHAQVDEALNLLGFWILAIWD